MNVRYCLSVIAVAGLIFTGLSACGGDEGASNAPVQDETMLTVYSSGKTVAFGYSASKGYHLATVASGDIVKYAGSTHQAGFSGSLSGSTGFSSALSGSHTFSAKSAGATSFAGGVPSTTQFSGTISTTCNFASLCSFASRLCEALAGATDGSDSGCNDFNIGQCYAAASSSEGIAALNSAVSEDPALAGLICVIIDYLDCVLGSSSGLDVSDSVATQCADSSGLTGAFGGMQDNDSN
ncbi:MAG: hypothetical protein H7Z43_05170 [Clostridia bacterium]|nr:hypothetical protein [Deltaproteobacteria bacterium]